MYVYYTLFFFITLLSIADVIQKKQRNIILSVLVILLTIFVAFRGGIGGDGLNYLWSWEITPTLFDDDLDKPQALAYSESGYYALTVLLKTIWDSPIFYFGVVALLGLVFLIKSLQRYALYPMMGLVVYMSRFFILRDFNQIRAAVAISIIIFATRYIAEKNSRKFFFFWLTSLCFHSSMIIVLPFYYLNRIQLNRNQIYKIIGAIFCASFIINKIFEQLFTKISTTFNILTAYTGDTEMAAGNGMLNPMIYFQLIILILFTKYEPYLKDKQPYYYTIRNGYLYSTCILMAFSSLLVIGSRLSTIFATYEIFILPALISILSRPSRILGIIFLYFILIILFIFNLSRAGGLEGYGTFL